MSGLRSYSWQLECITWSPLETSLVPLLFENAKPFRLLINCETLCNAKNVLAFAKKMVNQVERLVDYRNGFEVFILYLFKVHNANKESWGEGAEARE